MNANSRMRFLTLAASLALMASEMPLVDDKTFGGSRFLKTPLNKKQQKSRVKAKMAKKNP